MKLLFLLPLFGLTVGLCDVYFSIAQAGVNKCRVNGKIVYSSSPCTGDGKQEKISHSGLSLKKALPSVAVGNLSVHGVRSDWDCSSIDAVVSTIPSRLAATNFVKQIQSMDKNIAKKMGGFKIYKNSAELTIIPTKKNQDIKCRFKAVRVTNSIKVVYSFSINNFYKRKDLHYRYMQDFIDGLKARAYNLARYKSGNSSYYHKWTVANTRCKARLSRNITTDEQIKSVYFHVECNGWVN